MRQPFFHRLSIDLHRMTDEELSELADFMVTQIDSIDPADICYAAYVGSAVPGARMHIIDRLLPKILLAYRKMLIEWFEFALMKRANAGGGGTGIKRIEKGLAAFVQAIPDILLGKGDPKLSSFVEDNDYILPSKMDPVGFAILKSVGREAYKAGIPLKSIRMAKDAMPKFDVDWDSVGKLYYLPNNDGTYNYRGELYADGFRWNRGKRRWEIDKLTSSMKTRYNVIGGPVPVDKQLKDWFWDTWLPNNIDRFTKVFTDYARNNQTSYKMVFKVAGSRKVGVKFTRGISTAWEAVEELRYRYTGRQGRESWLEVMDRFIELVRTTSPGRLPHVIDRMNNLEHSNGMFMEHFPKDVQSWYGNFLNQKYHTRKADELALNIADRDLKDLLIELTGSTHGHARPSTFRFEPPADYRNAVKELDALEDKINWRKRGYPKMKGYSQVDRFDPAVQSGLQALKALDARRERILSTAVHTQDDVDEVMDNIEDYLAEHDKLVAELEINLEAMRRRWLDSGYLDDGVGSKVLDRNFPQQFINTYPYAARIERDNFRRFMGSRKLRSIASRLRGA